MLIFFDNISNCQVKVYNPLSEEIAISKDTIAPKGMGDIAIGADGNGIVVWYQDNQVSQDSFDVYGQLFSTDSLIGDSSFLINSFPYQWQWDPKVAMDAVGNFVVVWGGVHQDNSGWGVFGQRYNNRGEPIGNEFQVNSSTLQTQYHPDIAMNWRGDFVVVWEGFENDTLSHGVFGKVYDKEACIIEDEFKINETSPGFEAAPRVAMDIDTNFTVIWLTRTHSHSDTTKMMARQFSWNDTLTFGAEFQIDSFSVGKLDPSDISMNWQGEFVVTWRRDTTSNDCTEGCYNKTEAIWCDLICYEIYAQKFTKDGKEASDIIHVNKDKPQNNQMNPKVFLQNNGSFFVSWYSQKQFIAGSTPEILGKTYTRNNQALGETIKINRGKDSYGYHPVLAGRGNHMFMAWASGDSYNKVIGLKLQPHIEISDTLKNALTLPMNKTACGNLALNTNLSLAHPSSSIESSGLTLCESEAKDVWFKVKVPNTRNFLIKQQSDTITRPFIQAFSKNANGEYIDLENDICQDMSRLPYIALYTNINVAIDSLWFRVWQKDAFVDTTTIELSAHELTREPQNWELCDYPASALHVDGAGLKLGVQFFAQYDSLGMDTIRDSLIKANAQKIDSCFCKGNQLLELWGQETFIELDTSGRGVAGRTPQDTTKTNFIIPYKEVQFYNDVAGQQRAPSVGIDDEGNFVLAWADNGRDSSAYGIVAQRFNNRGEPLDNSRVVNTFREGYQTYPSVAMNGDGKFGITWQSFDQGIKSKYSQYAQLFDKSGNQNGGEIPISPPISSNIGFADMDSTGNMYITYFSSFVEAEENLIMRSIIYEGDSFFATNEVIKHEAGKSFEYPAIATKDDGASVIAYSGSDQKAINAHIYDTNGRLVNSIIVDDTDSGGQWFPDVDINNQGDFVVVWQSNVRNDENGDKKYNKDIYARKFSFDGKPLSPEILVNKEKEGDGHRDQDWPRVAMYDNGGFLVVWQTRNDFTEFKDIKGQLFDGKGNPVDTNFAINDYTDNNQLWPALAINKKGDVIICWQSYGQDLNGNGVYSKRYSTSFKATLTVKDTTFFTDTILTEAAIIIKDTIVINNTNITVDTLILNPIKDIETRIGLGGLLAYDTSHYNLNKDTTQIRVAIVDTGVKKDHPELTDNLWRNPKFQDENLDPSQEVCAGSEIGANFYEPDLEPIDSLGHGTAVNGLLINKDTIEKEVKIELMNVKFHNKQSGTLFDGVCGIYYAIKNGARVINLSWGFESKAFPVILYDALRYAADNDVLVVTSAGNTGQNNDKIKRYPGNLHTLLDSTLLVVAAYQQDVIAEDTLLRLSRYSNFGDSTVHIAARGYVETLALKDTPNGLTTQAGTSMAAPLVAKTAAIIRAKYPQLSARQVNWCITSTKNCDRTNSRDVQCLKGKLNKIGILDHQAALIKASEL